MLRTLFALALTMLIGSMTVAAQPEKPADTEYQSHLAKIDKHFKALEYPETESALKAALKKYPNDGELLWRYCSLMINWGDAAESDEQEEAMYRRSVEYGEAAVKALPKNANAHALLAAAYGSLAMFLGGKEKVKMAYKIRDELDEALKYDSMNEVAHTVYGTWHRVVADVGWIERQLANLFLGGLPDGSFEKSIYHFKKAIEVNPEFLRHYYQLGLTYVADDQEEMAVKTWKRGVKCPATLKADIGRKKEMYKLIEKYSD